MVQTHLAKQCKHVNIVIFFTTIKIYNTTGGKTPDPYSVSKLWLLMWRKALHHIMFRWTHCNLGLWGFLELTCLHQSVRSARRSFFLCLTKFLESDREPAWNQVAKWGLWWIFHSKEFNHAENDHIKV